MILSGKVKEDDDVVCGVRRAAMVEVRNGDSGQEFTSEARLAFRLSLAQLSVM